MPKMHQYTFGGRAPPGPAGEAYARPRPSSRNSLILRGEREREGGGLLLRGGTEGMEMRKKGKKDRNGGERNSPKVTVSRINTVRASRELMPLHSLHSIVDFCVCVRLLGTQ